MKGYGFGIWIIPNQELSHPKIKHIPHITIMCNVLNKKELDDIYVEIKKKMGNTFIIKLGGDCVEFTSQYSNDPLSASGFNCTCDKWNELKDICEKYDGSFSYKPHLSYYYSKNKEDLEYKNTLSRQLICTLKKADINSEDCTKWYLL
jgi:hypothetical protein